MVGRRVNRFAAALTAVCFMLSAALVSPAFPASEAEGAGTGTTWYVSPSGSDASGTGTQDRPWGTLEHASAQVAAPGDTIYLTAGRYTLAAQVSIAPGVNLTGAGAGAVTVVSSLAGPYNNVAAVSLVSSDIIDGNQSVSGIRFDGNSLAGDWALDIVNRNNVEVFACEFINFNFVAVGWRSSTTGGLSGHEPPDEYVTGGSFHDNITRNCAGAGGGYHRGALFCGGLYDFEIYNNSMIEDGRAAGQQGWPIKFWYYSGWMVDCKIHDNYLEKTDNSVWPFAIEGDGYAGVEMWNNTILGAIDLNRAESVITVNGRVMRYDYSAYIHDNIIGPDTAVNGYQGVLLEYGVKDVLVENNIFRRTAPVLYIIPRANGVSNVVFRYNSCTLPPTGWYAVRMQGAGIADPLSLPSPDWVDGMSMPVTGVHIYGNLFQATGGGDFGVIFDQDTSSHWAGSDITISDNIFSGFGYGAVLMHHFSTLSGARVTGNTFRGCGQVWSDGRLNGPAYFSTAGTQTDCVISGNTEAAAAPGLLTVERDGRVLVMAAPGAGVTEPGSVTVTQSSGGSVTGSATANLSFTGGLGSAILTFSETQGRTYTYRAQAGAPAAGCTLTARSGGVGEITLTAGGVGGADGYEIYRSVSGSFVLAATLTGASPAAWTDDGLAQGTAYSYRARAFTGSGAARVFGAYSPTVTAVSGAHVAFRVTPNVNGGASKLYEPWGLRYFAVYEGADAGRIADRGMAILKDVYYTGGMSAAALYASPQAHIFTNSGGGLGYEPPSTRYPAGRWYATLTEGIYSYDIGAAYYVVPFAVMDNGERVFGAVKSNSMEAILRSNLRSASITAQEKAVCSCILDLRDSVAAHYAAAGVPGALDRPVIARGSSQTAAGTGSRPGVSPNVVAGASRLIEPWGLRFFARIDGSGLADRGMVMLAASEYSAAYAAAPDRMRTDDAAYVFTQSGGTLVFDDESSRWYATLAEGISSKDIADVWYVVPYAVTDTGTYIYGTVKSNSMMSIMRKNLSSAAVPATEKAVSTDIIDLYNAVLAYYSR